MKTQDNLINGVTVKAFRLLTDHKQDSLDHECGFTQGRTSQCERASRGFTEDEIAQFCRSLRIKRRQFNIVRDILDDVYSRIKDRQRVEK